MRGHIRERAPGRWAVKIYVGRDPLTGKKLDRWFVVKGKGPCGKATKREAQVRAAELIAELKHEGFADPTKITVADHLSAWLDSHTGNVSAKTGERYREIVDKHLIPALGEIALTKLAPVYIQNYYGNALASGRLNTKGGPRGLSPRTVKHHHRVLSQALRHAVRLQIIRANPCDAVDPPRAVQREMNILSPAESAKLLHAVEGAVLHMPVFLALTTGMRRGEILALRWRNVDFDRGSLSVVKTLEQTAAGLNFKDPKTARSRRTISLGPLTVEAMRRHRAEQATQRLRLGPAYSENDLVCPNRDGTPRSPRELTKAFGHVIAKLRFPVRFHDLRHTHISHMLAEGVHPKIASERAGHASVAITLDVYSHVIPGMQEDAAMKIDAALRTELERAPA